MDVLLLFMLLIKRIRIHYYIFNLSTRYVKWFFHQSKGSFYFWRSEICQNLKTYYIFYYSLIKE